MTDQGYIKVKNFDPGFLDMEDRQSYVLEHRLVMAQHIGRPLFAYETVHHVDGDKQNNKIENLQLRIGQHGKGGVYECQDCGSFNITAIELRTEN